jgi:hypothetical protein
MKLNNMTTQLTRMFCAQLTALDAAQTGIPVSTVFVDLSIDPQSAVKNG